VTDRRTDRRTDGIAIAYARLAYMLSRAKILILKLKFYVRTVTTCSFAFLRKHAQNLVDRRSADGICQLRRISGSVISQVLHFPALRFGPSFSSLCSFLVRHFQVLQIQRSHSKSFKVTYFQLFWGQWKGDKGLNTRPYIITLASFR